MSLNQYLVSSKAEFLSDVASGIVAGWTVVMGNEAADLDSVSCALAYAYLTSLLPSSKPKKIVALIHTISTDLHLRPENEFALKAALVAPDSLLFLDQVENWKELKGLEFILVDSNRLLPEFEGNVIGIIDHHADEELYKEVVPRILKTSGSCSSLVTLHFSTLIEQSRWDSSIVDLLLSALLIDTGLKTLEDGGKAIEDDIKASEFLIPLSSVGLSTSSITPLSVWMDRNKVLGEIKADVENMNGRDLLRRDYKEYEFNHIKYGLATVPISFESWLKKYNGNWKQVEKSVMEWMVERNLQVLGVLTTYRSISKKGKKGSHARELLLRIVDEKLQGIYGEMETSDVLKLEQLKNVQLSEARVYQQGNDRATRKQVAPLLLSILTNLNSIL